MPCSFTTPSPAEAVSGATSSGFATFSARGLRHSARAHRLRCQSVRRPRADRPDGGRGWRRDGQFRGQRHEAERVGYPRRHHPGRYGQRLRQGARHVRQAARSGAADCVRARRPGRLRTRQQPVFRQRAFVRHLHHHLAAHLQHQQAPHRQAGLSDRGGQGVPVDARRAARSGGRRRGFRPRFAYRAGFQRRDCRRVPPGAQFVGARRAVRLPDARKEERHPFDRGDDSLSVGRQARIIRQLQARQLDIRSALNEPTDVDGQKGAGFPLHIECLPGGLQVMCANDN